MVDLVVVVPSRNRPGTATQLADGFAETCSAHTLLAFAVDESDPTAGQYAEALKVPIVETAHATAPDWDDFAARRVGVFRTPAKTMIECLNAVGVAVTTHVQPFAVGFMGDDNRPRTPGWDTSYLTELHDLGSGIVYGNDLIQGPNLPTQMAMTADIVRELGWLGPPTLTHLYVDNFWRDLGNRAGCLRYLPDVIIEHLHPFVGKGEVDEGYRRVNAPGAYKSGETAYRAYTDERLDADATRVAALRTHVRA